MGKIAGSRGLNGVRLDPNHDQRTRAKIQTTQLIKRLTDHIIGDVKLSATQVTAALGLLKKSLPDLTATELSGEVARPTVIRAPATVSDSRSWLNQYGPGAAQDSSADDKSSKPN